MNSIEEIRGQFPALEQKVYGKPLVYLDNGATSQKPQCVLDLLDLMHHLYQWNYRIHQSCCKQLLPQVP